MIHKPTKPHQNVMIWSRKLQAGVQQLRPFSSRTSRFYRLRAHKSLLVIAVLCLIVSAAPSVVAHSSSSFESITMQASAPHQHMCSLLFQTPACTQPAIWKRPIAAPRPGAGSCSQDTCSLSGPSAVQAAPALPGLSQGPSRRRVKAAAQLASSTTSTSTQQWWKKQSELWVDIHTEEQFYLEINSGDRLVFVGKYPWYIQLPGPSCIISHARHMHVQHGQHLSAAPPLLQVTHPYYGFLGAASLLCHM